MGTVWKTDVNVYWLFWGTWNWQLQMTMLGEFQIQYKLYFCGGLHCTINFKILNYFVLWKVERNETVAVLVCLDNKYATCVRFLVLHNISLYYLIYITFFAAAERNNLKSIVLHFCTYQGLLWTSEPGDLILKCSNTYVVQCCRTRSLFIFL
jgi:hypothetical protein